jgi:lipopolysaccharide transport system ATP-binding protein
MNQSIISVENLGKKYIIAHQQEGRRYKALRDVIASGVKSLGRIGQNPKSKLPNASQEEFWALKDVSFEIKQGDRVGIIGSNGAGKSTLLKVLSRITEPTTGKISIQGRVASLLEVGTGFHPELTGKENIYLNGAVMGMSKVEIKRKFDEIVAFAGVEKFLDTPVKRYSSGMYVRLAFSVAAHLEPEILVVDEVLAVGDAAFQKKCLGKMKEVSTEEGRTVLFVSHQMSAVSQICNRGIVLESGTVYIDSITDEAIEAYVKKSYNLALGNNQSLAVEWRNPGNQFCNPCFKPLLFFIGDENGNPASIPVRNDSDLWLYIKGEIETFDPALTVGYAIFTEQGNLLYWSYQTDGSEEQWPVLKNGTFLLRSQFPKRLFNEGTYRIELIGSLHFREWLLEPYKRVPYLNLTIEGGLSDSPYWMSKRSGILAPVMKWEVLT